jgi:hypothetical protein
MTEPFATKAISLSDRRLFDEVAEVVSHPRVEPADSFALHAPLEVLARAELFGRTSPEYLPAARSRLAEVATHYEAFSPAVDTPQPFVGHAEAAAKELLAAAEQSDVERADAAASTLADICTSAELVHLLAEPLAPFLTAAGHAPIFLHLLPRHSPGRDPMAAMLRPLAHELVRPGALRLEWIDRVPLREGSAGQLLNALDALPLLGLVGNGFIFPTMHRVDGASESKSIAANAVAGLVGGVDIGARARALQRSAAWSMVREPNEHAPYGWTHCLTMAQAVLGTASAFADPARALAIAASHVVGFRTSMASTPSQGPEPVDPRVDVAEALDGIDDDASIAGAAAFHLDVERRPWLWMELAGRASAHHDAHLVKYTVACIDAARMDPAAEALYLSAVATLSAWWHVADRNGRPTE